MAPDENDKKAQPTEAAPLSLSAFLTSCPPDSERYVRDLMTFSMTISGNRSMDLFSPVIQLHCDSQFCNGVRWFQQVRSYSANPKAVDFLHVSYVCNNCGKTTKTFSLRIRPDGHTGGWVRRSQII